MSWYYFKEYVPAGERRRQASQKMEALRKQGVKVQPIKIEGRKIAKTFWGEAWCEHLEGFSDFENRLPRGRTYVRNGSVCHLEIRQGEVEAKVSGSEVYDVQVKIKTLPAARWQKVQKRCAGQIGSLLELLQGKLSDHVMEAVTDRDEGLFPLKGEMSFECSCPDWASMCKHVAAVLYGVGARLDKEPALLFQLRGVNQDDLIDATAAAAALPTSSSGAKQLKGANLGDVFGINLDEDVPAPAVKKTATKKATAKKVTAKKAPAKKTPGKKTAAKKTPAKKKTAVKKTAAKKTAAKKTASAKSAVKKKASVKKTAAKKSASRKKT